MILSFLKGVIYQLGIYETWSVYTDYLKKNTYLLKNKDIGRNEGYLNQFNKGQNGKDS